MTPRPKPLVRPDLERCQAEHSNGVNFMTFGGRRAMVRCENKPSCIVYETEPDEDGRMGSMSLCVNCFPICVQQMKDKKIRFELIERKEPRVKPKPRRHR